jgi:phage shock protein C
MNQHKKLYRSRTERILFGVCGGLGQYFNIDPVIVRIVFAILTFISGTGVLLYIVLLIVVPREPGELASSARKEKVMEFVEEVQDTAQSVAKEVKEEVKSIKGEFKKKNK